MIRLLVFRFAVMASLLLFVATALLWIRSYYWWDEYAGPNVFGTPVVCVEVKYGGIEYARGIWPPSMDSLGNGWASHRVTVPLDTDFGLFMGWGTFVYHKFLGWRYASGDIDWQHGPPMPYWNIRVPFYAPTAVFALLPVIWVVGETRKCRRERRRGCCVSCGYNLTANTSGVCPECSTPVPETLKIIT